MRRWRCGLSRRPPGSAKRFFVLYLLVLTGVCFWFLECRLKPVLEEITAHEATSLFMEAVSSAVSDTLQEEEITYEDLVSIQRDTEGAVLSVSSDVVQMNQLKTEVLRKTQESLREFEHLEVWVPIGTLLGGELFHGRGPKIPIWVTLSGTVTAEFSNTYESAGINQTRHQVLLKLNGDIYTYMTGARATMAVSSDIPVAETVIVGETPQFFAGNQSSAQ